MENSSSSTVIPTRISNNQNVVNETERLDQLLDDIVDIIDEDPINRTPTPIPDEFPECSVDQQADPNNGNEFDAGNYANEQPGQTNVNDFSSANSAHLHNFNNQEFEQYNHQVIIAPENYGIHSKPIQTENVLQTAHSNNYNDHSYRQGSDIDQTTNKLKTEFGNLSLISPKQKRERITKNALESLSEIARNNRKMKMVRNNSANYTKRNKEARNVLKNELEKNQVELENMRKSIEYITSNITNCIDFIKNYWPKNPVQNYYYLDNILVIENQIQFAETQKTEHISRIGSYQHIRELLEDFQNLNMKYDFAARNWELKARNTNTYGSTKSRAKSEMEKSKMQLRLGEVKSEIGILTDFDRSLRDIGGACRLEFQQYINAKNISIHEKYQMEQEDFDKYDQILAFFQIPDPS